MKASFEIIAGNDKGSGERWPSLVLQGFALSVNVSFFLKEMGNGFLLASVICIFSIFILQALNRRFLFLYPLNRFLQRPSPYIDTYILRIFIWLSFVLLFLGITKNYTNSSIDIPDYCLICLVILGFLFVPVVFWILTSFRITNRDIANKLGKKPSEFPGVCPKCGEKNITIIHKIKSPIEGEVIANCPKCGEDTIKVPLWVG